MELQGNCDQGGTASLREYPSVVVPWTIKTINNVGEGTQKKLTSNTHEILGAWERSYEKTHVKTRFFLF